MSPEGHIVTGGFGGGGMGTGWLVATVKRGLHQLEDPRLSQRKALAVKAALAALVLALARGFVRWWLWNRWRASRRCLQLTSPLEGASVKLAMPRCTHKLGWLWPLSAAPEAWKGHCPACKRPIDIRRSTYWTAKAPRWPARGRYAFVINLWGSSPAYVLGALVLGYSIRKTGTRHSLVCLHTSDVPEPYLRLLRRIWDCRQVEHIEVATKSLSVDDQCERFEKVFTKLHGMGLVDFAKICVMDIDLLVRSNIDGLFDLPAPAAMRRGMNDTRWPAKTGDPIDGRRFFLGKDPSKWSWSVGTGINAGVMLWQPDQDVFKEMLDELTEPNHPSHMRGNGPEQDYLSRFWADAPWTHIGVEYNFQLHQMFFALHPDLVQRAERVQILEQPERIKIVHYSGVESAKPWHRILDPKWQAHWPDRSRDDEYAELFAQEFMGHWLWVLKDRAMFERSPQTKDVEGMFLNERGEIWRKKWWEDGAAGEPEPVDIPESAARGASEFLRSALREWFDTFQDLERDLGFNLQVALKQAEAEVARLRPPEVERPPEHPSQGTSGGGGERGAPPQRSSAWSNWTNGTSASASYGALRRGFAGGRRQLGWDRPPNGWWVERLKDEPSAPRLPPKASVLCSAAVGRSFVTFAENGEEVFYEEGTDAEPINAVFLKIVGPHNARRFTIPSSSEDTEADLSPIRFWVEGVPSGSSVLVALLDVPPAAMTAVLHALAPLGVPQLAPPAEAKALASAGVCAAGGDSPGGFDGSRLGARFSTHASVDFAYSSIPLADP